jgi:hypothetical protein
MNPRLPISHRYSKPTRRVPKISFAHYSIVTGRDVLSQPFRRKAEIELHVEREGKVVPGVECGFFETGVALDVQPTTTQRVNKVRPNRV